MAKRRLSQRQLARIRASQEQRRQRARESSSALAEQRLSGQALGEEQSGLVIANYGASLIIEDSNGELCRCAVRQNLGTAVCGDTVVWQLAAPGEGVVSAIEPRRSLLTRPDYSGELRPVAANLDLVAIVIAPRPEANEFLIDRYLAAIAHIDVAAILVVNKVDLLSAEELSRLRDRFATYARIGYPQLEASTVREQGLTALQSKLQQRTAILVGQSGVGKSSLVNALLPNRDIRVQALSAASGLGTHTTTTSMLYHLPGGGNLIDSPGVRSFEPAAVPPAALGYCFVEFRPHLGHCRYSNCSHTVEPDCALLAAVKRGELDPRRLQSYHQISASLNTRNK